MTKRLRRLLIPIAALVAFAALAPATASATSTPAPGYGQFTGCPHPGQNPLIVTCFRSITTKGELQFGNKKMPFEKEFKLSGGITGGGMFDFNSFGGLEKVKHKVPGGVVGLTGYTWLLEYFGSSALTLYAEIELAGTPSGVLGEPVSLPIKLHMIHPVLGNSCYIGSNAEPIELELITDLLGNYVDSSYAVPGASGCVLTLFEFPAEDIDHDINTASVLPSEPGSDSTTQTVDTETALAELVYP